MSLVQETTLMRPSLPTLIQFGFFVFWLMNITMGLLENFFIIFIIMVCIGGLWGTSYTNFLYLANAKVRLSCDMNLSYYERELTLNILLIASDVGIFAATLLSFILKT